MTRDEDGPNERIDVLTNDVDLDPLIVTGVGSAIYGQSFFNPFTGEVSYTPPTTPPPGQDVFTYTVSDGVNPDVVGFVRVTVNPVDDGPQLADDEIDVSEDALVGTVVGTVQFTD